MPKLISIVVNCFNGEKYLRECLTSIINQSYKNWEVIFWDNQSTDQSKNILFNFKEKRFRYFKSSEFTNLSRARNLAIAKAKGDYISFLDVDDFWLEKKLESQVKFLEENDAALVYSNYYIYYDSNKKKKIFFNKRFPSKNILQELLKSWHVGLLTIFYNKRKVKNMYFDEKYHFIGDMDFVINNLAECKVLGQNEILAFMRLHENNETKKHFLQHTFELLRWYRTNKKFYFREKNIKYVKNLACYNLVKICIDKNRFRKAFNLFFYLNFKSKIKVIIIFFLNVISFKKLS